MKINKLKVKWFGGVLALAIAIWTLSGVALGEVNWRKYAGTKIRVVSWGWPYSELAVEEMIPEFEKKTGIKVNWETYGAWQMREKVNLNLVSKSSDIDAFWYQMNQLQLWLYKGDHIVDITEFIKNPDLTPSDWDWEDFPASIRHALESAPGNYGLPFRVHGNLLLYRTDLLKKAGISVPQNFEELEAAAAKLKQDGVAGWVARGTGSEAVWALPAWLFAYGGAFFDKDHKPALTKPESLRAIELYGKMLREYGPPEPLGIGWMELNSIFQSGKAAMCEAGDAAPFSDPERSQIVGKYDVTSMPAGPAGRASVLTVTMLAISKYSNKKEATWLFIQWLNNKENILKFLQNGTPVCRVSAWEDPRFKSKLSPNWVEASRAGQKNALYAAKPWVLSVEEVRDLIGTIIEAAIKGEDIKPVAQEVSEKIVKVMQRTGSIDLPIPMERVYMPENVWR